MSNNSHACGLFAGIATVDVSYFVEAFPHPNQKVSASAPQIMAGGPATNAAVTFAFLGGRSALATAVGQHALGAVIRGDLSEHKVRLHDIAASLTAPPPVSSILVLPNGDRTVVSPNASAFPDLEVDAKPEWFSGAQVALVDGHYPALCNAVAREARKAGIDVVLDAGSWKDVMPSLLPNTSVALCSSDFHPPGCATESDVFGFLRERGVERAAITRGGESILYFENAASGEIAVENVKPVDTTGAGDVFHGAFCYRYARGGSFADALSFAARVATVKCRHVGTRAWMREFGE